MNKYKTLLVSSFSILLLAFMLFTSHDYFQAPDSRLFIEVVMALSGAATIVFFVLDLRHPEKGDEEK